MLHLVRKENSFHQAPALAALFIALAITLGIGAFIFAAEFVIIEWGNWLF